MPTLRLIRVFISSLMGRLCASLSSATRNRKRLRNVAVVAQHEQKKKSLLVVVVRTSGAEMPLSGR